MWMFLLALHTDKILIHTLCECQKCSAKRFLEECVCDLSKDKIQTRGLNIFWILFETEEYE